jgi:hypothetical protein
LSASTIGGGPLSPRKSDPPPRPDLDIKSKILDALDQLVERMMVAAPDRRAKIHDGHRRLRRAFLGPISADEQTKPAQQGRMAGLDDDELEIVMIISDLAAQEFKINEAGEIVDGLRDRGLAGKIRAVLKQRFEDGKTDRPPWLENSIRNKLKRLKEKFLEEMITRDEGDPAAGQKRKSK